MDIADRDAAQFATTHERRRPSVGPADLERVLAYENDDVVERYVADHDADPDRAAELFDDLKRWLWLCAESTRRREAGELDVPLMTIFDGQTELDEMWHTFILFTAQYMDFCHRWLGRFVHHAPTPQREKRELAALGPEARMAAVERRNALLRRVAGHVFETLGATVARRWYLRAPTTRTSP